MITTVTKQKKDKVEIETQSRYLPQESPEYGIQADAQ